MLKYLLLIYLISALRCEVHTEIIDHAQKWHTIQQREPLGFCADNDPCLVELQLWHDDVALDPDPYHKVIQL